MPKCPSSDLRTILKHELLGEARLHVAVKVAILVIRNATDPVTAMLMFAC